MAEIVVRIAVVVDRVDSVAVVDVPVALVVHPRQPAAFRHVVPEVGGEIGVDVRLGLHTGVEQAHRNSVASYGEVPGLDGVDVVTRSASELPGVLPVPLEIERGIVGSGVVDVGEEVGLRVHDFGKPLVGGHRAGNVERVRKLEEAEVRDDVVSADGRGSEARVDAGNGCGGHVTSEPDQQLSRNVGMGPTDDRQPSDGPGG